MYVVLIKLIHELAIIILFILFNIYLPTRQSYIGTVKL